MSNFPKWLLALAGTNLIPILLCPFFLFGGLHPFGTSEYTIVAFLLYVLTQLLWLIPIGAFFLGVIAIVPILMSYGSQTLGGLALGGTTLLIVVGVALDTVKTLEAQMMMRHYKGFLD